VTGAAWDELGTSVREGRAVLYTAKCFWPGVTETELRLAAARARGERREQGAAFRGAMFLSADELVLCLFESRSHTAVKSASEAAGMPCERVIETVWVSSTTGGGDTRCGG
jgi:hypothetical protein